MFINRKILIRYHVLCALVGATPGIYAVESDSPLRNDPLEEIVVTATRTEKMVQVNPYSISVLTEEQLKFQPVDQIASLLRDLPGVYVSDAGQAGQQRLRIRGEEARRMAMLIDGQEFGDHREVGVPLLLDPGEIERIELVRGPSSILYGPKAMGGVVNIITKSVPDKPLAARVSTAYDSATNGVRLTASLGGMLDQYDWRVGYTNNDQQDRETPAGKIDNTSYQSEGLSVSLGRVMDDSEVRFRYEKFDSSSEVYVEPIVRFTPPFVDFALQVPKRNREKYALSYNKTFSGAGYLDSLQADVYRQSSVRDFRTFPTLQLGPVLSETSIITQSELMSDGANIQLTFLPGNHQELITGVQLVSDEIDQNRQRINKSNGVLASDVTNLDKASLSTLAFYIQDDLSLNDQWSLLLGARYYDVSGQLDKSDRFNVLPDFNDSELVSSAALTYSPDSELTWRLNYSDGYIFPSLLNLTMGAFAGSRYINPDVNLKPETSTTVEFGFRLNKPYYTVDAGFFETKADDYIDHLFCVPGDACLGPTDKIYKNVGSADTRGIELAATYDIASSSLYSNFTWLKRRKQYEGVDTYKSGIPKFAGTIGWKMQTIWRQNRVGFDVSTRFASSADEAVSTRSGVRIDQHSKWGTVNAAFNLATPDHYRATLLVVNLLDKEYSPSTENLLAPGRSFQLMLSAEI